MNVKEVLARIAEVDGFLGGAVVDSSSGMVLGALGGGPVDIELAAAGNTEVVRAKRKTMKSLGLKENIEDILITLGTQYHLIRPVTANDELFIYVVLDKTRGNLGLARFSLNTIEKTLVV